MGLKRKHRVIESKGNCCLMDVLMKDRLTHPWLRNRVQKDKSMDSNKWVTKINRLSYPLTSSGNYIITHYLSVFIIRIETN